MPDQPFAGAEQHGARLLIFPFACAAGLQRV